MKRFVIRMIICFLILSVGLIGLNAIYVNTDYYIDLNGMDKYRHVPQHLDIVNFGISHSEAAYCWDIVDEGVDCFNMALAGQSLVEDANWLDYFDDRIDENTTVVLDVTYWTLYGKDDKHNQARYYQILPRQYIYGWNMIDAVQYAYLPILGNRSNGLDAIWKKIVEHREKEVAQDFNEVIKVDEEENLSKSRDVENNSTEELTYIIERPGDEAVNLPTSISTYEEMIEEGRDQGKAADDLTLIQCDERYNALCHMIERCKEKGCSVILTTVPILPCYRAGFSDGLINRFYNDINNISNYYDVPYVDYSQDSRFAENRCLFYDTDHLNSNGAKMYTQIFLEENKELLTFEYKLR